MFIVPCLNGAAHVQEHLFGEHEDPTETQKSCQFLCPLVFHSSFTTTPPRHNSLGDPPPTTHVKHPSHQKMTFKKEKHSQKRQKTSPDSQTHPVVHLVDYGVSLGRSGESGWTPPRRVPFPH